MRTSHVERSRRAFRAALGEGVIIRLSIALSLLFASIASGQTTQPTVSATLGFSGVFKPDAWAPVYVRVSDAAAPRAASIEIRTARGKLGHEVLARVTTSSAPRTYTLYAPIGGLDRVSLQLRDERGTLLESIDLTDAAQATPAALGGPVFGIAGPEADAQRLVNQLVNDTGEYAAAGALATSLLPERTIGYASIDCLVLPGLDADAIAEDVQSAIVSWVRSGGIVVAWPGAQAATRSGPLSEAMPADFGAPGSVTFNGRAIVGRLLAVNENAISLDDIATDAIAQRRLGLGQIVMLAFDPTRLPNTAAADRVALWRRLVSGQLAMSSEERRAGVFDPLVAQAVGEQQLSIPPREDFDWHMLFAAGALVGLLLGPGELLLLAAAGRHPRTPYTLAGVGLTVACSALWLGLPRQEEPDMLPRIDVRLEAADGLAASIMLGAAPADGMAATWLTSDRVDPTQQPASELRLLQREDRLLPGEVRTLETAPAKVRAIRFAGATLHPPRIVSDAGQTRIANASDAAWDAMAVVGRDALQLVTEKIDAGQTLRVTAPTTPADNAATRRVETGIESLAAQEGWAAILMDRRLAERLVRLLETEQATIIATRGGGGKTFTLHVIRQGGSTSTMPTPPSAGATSNPSS